VRVIEPVTRSRAEAKANYDRLARAYELVSGRFEAPHREEGLRLLDVREGERVLEVGFGTGACVVALARAVGTTGSVKALDLSSGMRAVAQARVEREGVQGNVELITGDAAALPWSEGSFDAVFSSFVLELFDTPELPKVLAEWGRVLKRGGRLGLVSLVTPPAPKLATRLYAWAHRMMPTLVDCRAIPLRELVEAAGFQVEQATLGSLAGLPVQALVARR